MLERWLAVDATTRTLLTSDDWILRFDEKLQALTNRPSVDRSSFGGSMIDCASCLGEAAVVLQQSAGFAVDHHGALPGSEITPLRLFAEYDLEEAGALALDLSVDLLAASLRIASAPCEAEASFVQRYRSLCELARQHATPAHTQALIEAARRRDVPHFRMDREPYVPVQGTFRLRPNGLLRLGQARHQQTVDGSFCIERSQALHACALNRSLMIDRVKGMACRLPLAVGESMQVCNSPLRAARRAQAIGFPVVLKNVQRGQASPILDLKDSQAVINAASRRVAAGPVYVEPQLSGRVLELIYIGQRRLVVIERGPEGATGVAPESIVPLTLLKSIDALAAHLEVLCLSVALVVDDQTAGASARVIDIDPAPPLDRLLRTEPSLLQDAGDRMIRWLFPDPQCCRIPIAAITGTNGKTTTCFLLDSILRQSGARTGMACSTGCYLDGNELNQFEDSYLPGHLTIIDNASVEVAVLETTRGAAMSSGVGFDRCDVAACLNVSNDHLDDELEISSVAELARIKQWIVERGARPVLNADDSRCLAMARALQDRAPVLVSTSQPASALVPGPKDMACVVETIDQCDWIVLHEGTARAPVMALTEVPICFAGLAEHNVSNALHAVAMARVLGVDIGSIASGLAAVKPDPHQLPGRLNLYQGHGLQIIVDYAHNADGLERLASFCQRLEVPGRRIIAVTLPANRGDDFVVSGVSGIAGVFDHYVCKNYRIRYGRQAHEVPALLRTGLERAGVTSDRITTIEDEDQAITETLEMARPGDLIVLIVGKEFRVHGRMVQEYLDRDREDPP